MESPADACVSTMPADAARSLKSLRTKVAAAAKLPMAQDLVPSRKGNAELLSAHERYQGNMYRRIPEEAWAKPARGVEVVIVSALYGPIHFREPVRPYAFSMGEKLPKLGVLHTWWRDHGLPAILAAYLNAAQPKQVTDLLSGHYRQSTEGYLALTKADVEQVDFPGMGRGSQPARGKKVADLLRGSTA